MSAATTQSLTVLPVSIHARPPINAPSLTIEQLLSIVHPLISVFSARPHKIPLPELDSPESTTLLIFRFLIVAPCVFPNKPNGASGLYSAAVILAVSPDTVCPAPSNTPVYGLAALPIGIHVVPAGIVISAVSFTLAYASAVPAFTAFAKAANCSYVLISTAVLSVAASTTNAPACPPAYGSPAGFIEKTVAAAATQATVLFICLTNNLFPILPPPYLI